MSFGSMGERRSAINCLNLEIYVQVFVGFMLIYTVRVSRGYTNPGDVAAINNLYAALGYPPLPGWVPSGGDPCADAWQGVQCIDTDINSITLNGANLGGQLGDNLGSFSSIKAIGLSNNHIGGSIPPNLPLTIQNFFLSDNQFTGSIPSSLSSLSQLSAMSLNNNQLTGALPDAFQGLTVLVNLDLSRNNLSGKLPPSLENLSSLTTLHLQDNQLAGSLDVLQDLPLRDLNIENNLFSGPIPENLLSIPNFKNDGNPFNSTITPLPPPTSPTIPQPVPPLSGGPSSEQTPGNPANGPSSVTEESNSKRTKKILTTKSIVGISIGGVFLFIIFVLGVLLFMPKCCEGRRTADRISKQHEIIPYIGIRENTADNGSLVQPKNQTEKVARTKEEHQTGSRRMGLIPVPWNEQELNMQRLSAIPKPDDLEIDMSRFDIDSISPPPPPPPSLPPTTLFEKVTVKPIAPAEVTTAKPSTKSQNPPTTVKFYTIAALQQYTNSFSQENLIGGGMLGSVYRAQLPDGKVSCYLGPLLPSCMRLFFSSLALLFNSISLRILSSSPCSL